MTQQDKTLNELSKLLDGLEKELRAIRDSLQREPREWWLETDDTKDIIDIHDKKPPVLRVFHDIIHVREII